MRIASLQPSVSLTLAQLGRLDALCAVTRYCVEVVAELDAMGLPVLQDSWSFDRDHASTELLLAARPDLVIASVPYRMESLAAILKAGVPVLALAPKCLADVYHDIVLIGRQVDAVEAAETLVHTMQSVIAHTAERVRSEPIQTVYCEEWGKPLIASQTWVAELIAAANGEFIGAPGATTDAEEVTAADPDVLLFAWCGAGDRVPLERVIQQRGWEQLRAVRNGRVFCIPDEFLNTPAFNLLEGLACIAAALHPEQFATPPRMRAYKA